jgi:predicted phosphodiesterase
MRSTRHAIVVVLLLGVVITACRGNDAPPDEATRKQTRRIEDSRRKDSGGDRRATRRERGESDRDQALATVRNETFRLAVIGDFGEGNRDEHRVSDAVRAWVEDTGANALVTTGDNIYPAGDPEYFEDAWREPYGWVKRQGLEIIASLGNHDVEAGQGDSVMRLLGSPSAWYRDQIGSADLFVLDANRPTDGEQSQWLEKALSSSEAAWQIAVFHQPAFSCSNHGSTPEVVQEWVPLFERYGVDLVLNGHDHNYQRFFSNGVTYVVTGGGGAELYGLRSCDDDHPERIEGSDEEHHFVGVFGSEKTLRLVAIEDDEDVIDVVRLNS